MAKRKIYREFYHTVVNPEYPDGHLEVFFDNEQGKWIPRGLYNKKLADGYAPETIWIKFAKAPQFKKEPAVNKKKIYNMAELMKHAYTVLNANQKAEFKSQFKKGMSVDEKILCFPETFRPIFRLMHLHENKLWGTAK